jgi:peroxiredoxin
MMALVQGDKIKAFSFADQSGKVCKFPDDFPGEKLALFFLRHLGCPLCKVTIADLKAEHARFAAKGVKTVVVVQSTAKRVEEYARKENLPYILVSDREKVLYESFFVRRGGIKEFTAPAAFKKTIRATLKGHMHGAFEGDEFQVPASFLLSPESVVLYAHYGKDISDFGSVEEVLKKA